LAGAASFPNFPRRLSFFARRLSVFDSIQHTVGLGQTIGMLRPIDSSWKMPAAIYTMLICSSITLAAQNFSVLTGRFVARIGGPAITTFGGNQQSYVFETTAPSHQFVVLSYVFLQYEPRLPDIFDYSHVYTFSAEENEQCGGSIDEISKRYLFGESGTFLGVKYAIEYSKNAPPLLPMNTPLHCYLLDHETVSLLNEVQSEPFSQH
jgi:hypothetical protein